ncbi:MAG: cobalt transporter [Candidatus Puniceispirillum sp. TMED52]|nr:cobalt transporter [SAR116 cluster bacterium]OUU46171.1 MAG: cobalt transporter [Candidatus Puniceispirillum sp. TMED52]
MFTRVVISALFAGCLAGLIGGVLQLFFVQPVLLHAELYESGQLTHFGSSSAADTHHTDSTFDLTRDLLSLGFSMAIYVGYGLIMTALMAFRLDNDDTINPSAISPHQGIIWGLAGFIAVQFAPGFGLPPEVPGVASASLEARQIWWLATVVATAFGIWLIAFGRTPVVFGLAILLILAPHVIGAPEPQILQGPVPPEIASHFAARALGVGMAAWVILGLCSSYFLAQSHSDTD